MSARTAVGAGVGAATGVGGAVVGGWPAAVVLGLPVVAVAALLVWVLVDTGRTRRMVDLIQAARTPVTQPPPTSPGTPALPRANVRTRESSGDLSRGTTGLDRDGQHPGDATNDGLT
ncbi:hypothetical protein [Streptomyces sp. NPDC058086]|uniref:hypothetical protein n=1 Tax=Streptomyces sp. NPDC058086 TaxID=3346334 RepID=UPI0036E8949E